MFSQAETLISIVTGYINRLINLEEIMNEIIDIESTEMD